MIDIEDASWIAAELRKLYIKEEEKMPSRRAKEIAHAKVMLGVLR